MSDHRPAPVPLAKLVDGISGAVIIGRGNVSVEDVAYHSAQVKPGDLFVCRRGGRDDGHRHAHEAVGRGRWRSRPSIRLRGSKGSRRCA